jgi:hypothetical protein
MNDGQITYFERFGDYGWRWGIEWYNPSRLIHMRTNVEGDGLFSRSDHDSAYHQQRGTAQFGLHPTDQKRARRQVQAMYARGGWSVTWPPEVTASDRTEPVKGDED